MVVLHDIHSGARPRTGLFVRLAGAVKKMQQRRAQGVVYRQTLRELEALSDRDLSDLGLSRSMIRRVAYEAAYK